MEQRRYRSALTPEALGDLLVAHFDEERRTEARRLGGGDSVLVQVRHGHDDHQRVALTIGIARQVGGATAEVPGITHPAEEADPAPTAPAAPDLVVTIGEQQWFGPELLGGVVLGSLIGALFTPWALFGLIWPLSQVVREYFAGHEIGGTIDTFVLTQGGELLDVEDVRHPHGGVGS